jgi:hypothetical protein
VRQATEDSPGQRKWATGLACLLAGAAVGWHLVTAVTWIRTPYAAGIPPPDSFIYDCGDFSGYAYGYGRVRDALREWDRAHEGRTSVVAADRTFMGAYWGERVGGLEGWQEESALRVVLARWLGAGDTIFFVDEVPLNAIPDSPFGATLEEVAAISDPCGDDVVRLRRMTGAGPEIQRDLYEVAFPDPNEIAEQYRAMAVYLIETGAQGAVVVYPPNQLDLLANRLAWGTELDGVYAIGDSWPLDTQAVASELEGLAAEHGDLHVVFYEETRGDREGTIRGWLDANMRPVSQDWFGPVELLHYASR